MELYYTQRIVIADPCKYVYNGFGYDEIYDLKQDPYEMVNLSFPDVKLACAGVETGRAGLEGRREVPSWPPLSSELAKIRHDLLMRMWKLAQEHKNQIFNPYITVALKSLDPAVEL